MKRLIIPAIILIVIFAIWFIQSKIETRSTSAKTISGFLKLDPAEVNKITVKTATDNFIFALRNGRWYLEGEKPRIADSSAVINMITSSADMKVGNIISENPERQKDFLVDTLTGNLVQFYNGESLLNSIFIGKMSSDYTHTYVRKPGSKEVYLCDGLLTYIFNRRRPQWLNRAILSFAPESAKEVEFIYPDKNFRITKATSEWYVAKSPYTDSLPTDSMKTDAFLRQAGMLRASDFVGEADSGKMDFSRPAMTLNVSLVNGSTEKVEFASADSTANRFYCRTPEGEDIFVLSKSVYSNMLKQAADFLRDK